MNIFKIKKRRDFGSLITDSFLYVRYYIKSLGKSVLYFVVPFMVLSTIFTYHYSMQVHNIQSQLANNPLGIYTSGAYLSALGARAIFSLLTMTALITVVFNHMKLAARDQYVDENIRISDIWDGVKSDFLMILLLSVCVYFVSSLGAILLIIGMIFLLIKFQLVTAAYILEDTGFGNSFSRSWYLTKDYWWLTFGLLFVMGILIVVMSFGISIPVLILSAFSGFAGAKDPGSILSIFSAAAAALGYVFYILLYICMGLHFYNLVERKEGTELSDRIDQIATENV